MSGPYLSVIIPCFNEEERLGSTLDATLETLRRKGFSWEIIIVDDGSRDRTVEVAEQKLSGVPYQILREPQNQGKGYAVKKGMLAARGQFLLFTDADLSTPMEEAGELVKRLEDGFDIAIGSRALPESKVEVHQNFMRESMGKIFNRIARFVSFTGVRDSQCGFKCFRRDIARTLFEAQKITGFSFDAEILYLAQKRGYRIAEVPVTWRNSPKSRVHILKDSLRMLIDVLRIPWIHR